MSEPRSNVPERPYHHGDLRRAIVTAALDILSETQSHEFSLRELARRAGQRLFGGAPQGRDRKSRKQPHAK